MTDYTAAVNSGAKDEFARLGIEVVAADRRRLRCRAAEERHRDDPGQEAERSSCRCRSIPTTAAEVYRPALEAGAKLVFVDNAPKGFVQGKDYVDDRLGRSRSRWARRPATRMAAAIGGKGKVGYIFHDADFYVTNQRDQRLQGDDRAGLSRHEDRRRAGPRRSGPGRGDRQRLLTQNPDLDAVYVTWAEPALSVLAALRNAGNTHTKIVTLDLSEPLALDMVKGGNVAAIVADEAYDDRRDRCPRRGRLR